MKMLKVMEKRRTVREYDPAPLNAVTMTAIEDLIDSMPIFTGTEKVDFIVLENGDTVFQALKGVAGYNGHMIEAPHYFLITCSGDTADYQTVGYLGEWLALQLAKKDIGTCWISVNGNQEQVAQKLELEVDGTIAALMAFGEAKEDKKLSKIYAFGETTLQQSQKNFDESDSSIKDENYAYKNAITEFVYLKKFGTEMEYDEIAKRGMDEVFYYMRNAPSWGNLQPWKFILDGSCVILAMAKNPEVEQYIQDVDAGIAMLYFEVAMHDHGLAGKWNVDADQYREKLAIPENYNVIGFYC